MLSTQCPGCGYLIAIPDPDDKLNVTTITGMVLIPPLSVTEICRYCNFIEYARNCILTS